MGELFVRWPGYCHLAFVDVFPVDRIESYYALRAAEGGDRAFGDLGFVWLVATISMGLVGFGLRFVVYYRELNVNIGKP